MINFQEVNQSSGYMHENVHCALILKKVGRSQFFCIKTIFLAEIEFAWFDIIFLFGETQICKAFLT